MDEKLPIFWASDTHHGVIKRTQGTTPNGVVHDLGIWASAAETKTGREEHTLPYDSVEAAMKRLTEKYPGFHVVSGPDAVAEALR